MQRRGEELRHHILLAAKDIFLETGYERASMDAVASRASTSKRTLYAFFDNKETLFVAVLELVRELYLGQLKTPADYAENRQEAATLFCARFLQLMVWIPQVRTCRLIIAEAERLPRSANAYFEAIFTGTGDRLGEYLAERGDIAPDAARQLAGDLLESAALPRLFRTLINVEPPLKGKNPPKDANLSRDVDLEAVGQLVAVRLVP